VRTVALLLLALPVLAGAARAVTGTDEEKLRVIATLGNEAAGMTSSLEADVSSGASAASSAPRSEVYARTLETCRAGFSMDGLMKSFEAGEIGRSDKNVDAMFEDAERYYECDAYAVNDPGRCENLKWFQADLGPRAHNREDLCREIFRKLTLSKSVIDGDPAAEKTCEGMYLQMIEHEDQVIKDGTVPETCAIITSDPDPESVCVKRSKLFIRPFTKAQMKECVFYQGLRVGSPKFCGLYPEKQEYCLQYAAYRKAHEAKDASLCGASVDCRLLMGEGPKACAGSVENLKTYYCRDRAERESDPAARAADAPALRARAAAASAALARWKKLMDAFAAKDLPAYRAESERLARESKRLDAVRRRVDAMRGA